VQALCHARGCPSRPGPPLPRESGLQLHGGVQKRAGEKSRDTLHLPYAGQQWLINFPFLCQKRTIMGGLPLSRRPGARRGRGVSCQSCTPGLRKGSLSHQGLKAKGLRTRALPDNPVLRSLCPHSHAPVCFPRPWQLLCNSCAAEGTHKRCSFLKHSTTIWECDSCAGLATGKRQSPQCPWAGAGSQERPGSVCPGWAWQSVSAPGGLAAPLWPLLPCT